jgi:hypothetical protein
MVYICTRSLRNGALTFVKTYSDCVLAGKIVDMANHGLSCQGPARIKYVVISAL